MMKLFALFIPAVAIQSSERSGLASLSAEGQKGVEKMRDEFRSIVVRGEISDNVKTAIQAILDELRDDIGPKIRADWDAADSIMKLKQSDVEGCADTRNATWNSKDIDGRQINQSTSQQAHATCQGFRETECQAACDKCDELEANVTGWESPTRPRLHDSWCNGDNYNLYAWVSTLTDWLEDHAAYYLAGKQSCSDLTDQCNNRTAECYAKQNKFERDICSWLTGIDEVCAIYDNCYEFAIEKYNDAWEEAKCMFDLANVQKQALEQCLCYGELIINETTNVSMCEDQAFTPWVIADYSVHEQINCSEREQTSAAGGMELIPRPCDALGSVNFYTQFYMSTDVTQLARGAEGVNIAWAAAAQFGQKADITSCVPCHSSNPDPFHLVARGACRSTDLAEGELGDQGQYSYKRFGTPNVDTAEECVEACRETEGCDMVSFHANTHDCWMDRSLGSIVAYYPTAWSCYVRSRQTAVEVREKMNISEDEYETLNTLTLSQRSAETPYTECLKGAPEDCI